MNFPWSNIIEQAEHPLRCPICNSNSIEVDRAMERYNEDLARTFYKCKSCKEKFTA